MIVRLSFLFPYYYYADDRDKFCGMHEWLKQYGGKFNAVDVESVEISEEDYVILKLRFGR